MESGKMSMAILGVGLIGGSMGLALKHALGDRIYIKGCSLTEEELKKAVEVGAVDEGCTDPVKAIEGAEIIYFSTPVLQILPMMKQLLPHIVPGTVITDAGSTKSSIAEGIWTLLPEDVYYVPGHPMTGRERSGVAAAQKDLFRNKAYLLVKDSRVNTRAQQKIRRLIELVGGCIYELNLAEHDRCASLISHIPHIMASAMVNLLEHNPEYLDSSLKLAGGGFKDTTRIASSNTVMWRDICIANKNEIAKHLQQMSALLQEMENAVEAGDIDYITDFFATAKARRDQILEDTKKQYDLI